MDNSKDPANVYKKTALGNFYVRLVTGKPYFFLSYIIFGFALILFIAIQTKIEVVKTCTAEVLNVDGAVYLSIRENDVSFSGGTVYLYSVKNEAVYPVTVELVSDKSGGINFKVEAGEGAVARDFLLPHIGDYIKAEIPVGKISLLEHIFVKGGKTF